MTELSTRAMLANVTIKQWSGHKLDKKITKEVHDNHGTSKDAGRFNKALMSKDALADIKKIAGAARNKYYELTLPWLDDGSRVLTNTGYINYANVMADYRRQFGMAVDEFCAGYEEFKADARIRLNGMFNEADYPPVSQIRGKFDFSSKILPVASAGDFRAEISNEFADKIRAEIESDTNEALQAAMTDVWQRVAGVAEAMAERLKAYKPATGDKRAEGTFRDSLVGNIRDLVSILPSLNLTNDLKLADMAERLERELCAHEPEELRESENLRESTANAASAILNEISDFIS